MKLSDIMGGLELTVFPQVALVLFLAIFTAVLLKVFGRGRRMEYERAAALPLEDGAIKQGATR